MRLTSLAVGDRAEIVLRSGAKRNSLEVVAIVEEASEDYAMVRVAWRHPAVVKRVRYWVSEFFLYAPIVRVGEDPAERVRSRRSRWRAPGQVSLP